MEIQTLFYFLGTIFFFLGSVLLVVFVFGMFSFFNRINRMQKNIETKFDNFTSSFFSGLATFVAIIAKLIKKK